jgi:chromosome segregation ATPase
MTKKRLSDLLREEVQKSEDAATPASDQADSESASASQTESADQGPATLDVVAEEVVDADATDSEEAGTKKRTSRTTKAELDQMVTELEQELEATQGREADLQKQVSDLQADLQEQQVLVRQLTAKLEPANQRMNSLKSELEEHKTLVKRLQTDLKQVDQLKAELAEAKQMILQLSEANTQAKTQASPQANTQKAITKPAARPVGLDPLRSASLAKTPSRQPVSVPELEDNIPSPPVDPNTYQPGLKRLRSQSIRPSSLPPKQSSMLSDDDIGWVD